MKKLLALVLALVMTLGLATVGANAALSDFSDGSDTDAKYQEALGVMNMVGVFTGDTTGATATINPTAPLTREAAAKLIAYLDLGETVAETLPAVKVFDDVEASRWSAKYIAYCKNAGYMQSNGGNNFDPTGELTGYMLGAYLLAVLGYDRAAEGITGADWQVACAKLLDKTGIGAGVTKAGSATLTRQEGAQYCFEALLADTVEYNNQVKVNAGDVNVQVGGGATPVSIGTYVNSFTGSIASGNLQLGEKLYKGALTLTGTTEDAQGRPAREFSYKADGETLKTVLTAKQAEGEVTGTLSNDSAVTTALANAGLKMDTTYGTVDVYLNGVYTSRADTLAKVRAEAKNGAKMEFYDTVNNNDGTTGTDGLVDKIFVTYDYLLKVPAITKANASAGTAAYYGFTGNATNGLVSGAYNLVSDAYAKGDYIVVTMTAVDTAPTKDNVPNARILTSAKAETISGKVTALGTSNQVTVDGTTYKKSEKAYAVDGSGTPSVGNSYTFYLDSYGNYIGWELNESAASTQYVFITSYQVSVDSLLNSTGGARAVARATFTDGTVKNIDLKVASNGAVKLPKADGTIEGDGSTTYVITDDTAALGVEPIGAWFGYTESDGKYTLSALNPDYAFQKVGSLTVAQLSGIYGIADDTTNAVYTTTKDTQYVKIDTDGGIATKSGFDAKATFAAGTPLLVTYNSGKTTVNGIYQAGLTDAGTAASVTYAYAVKADSTVANGKNWVFAVDGNQVTYTLYTGNNSGTLGGNSVAAGGIYEIAEDASHSGFYKVAQEITTREAVVYAVSGSSVAVYDVSDDTTTYTYKMGSDAKVFNTDRQGANTVEADADIGAELDGLSAWNKIKFVLDTDNETVLAAWVIDGDVKNS